MKTWQAIILTIVIIILISLVPQQQRNSVWFVVVLASAIWIFIDSKKLETHKYKAAFAWKPWAIALFSFILWIIGFPGYLSLRYKVTHKLAGLKGAAK